MYSAKSSWSSIHSGSLITSIDRVFHHDSMDIACLKLIESHQRHSQSTAVIEPNSKSYIIQFTSGIIRVLCEPYLPRSIPEVVERIDISYPCKLRPTDKIIADIQQITNKGRRRTTSLEKIHSCFKIICSIFDAPRPLGLVGVVNSPSLHRRPSNDYQQRVQQLHHALQACVNTLGIVVRILVTDSVKVDLAQLVSLTRHYTTNDHHLLTDCAWSISANSLLRSLEAFQRVIDGAVQVYNHTQLLAECVNDNIESQTQFLGPCLIDLAESETFQNYVSYAESLANYSLLDWIGQLTEHPHVQLSLAKNKQSILNFVFSMATSNRLPELELRYNDPHKCQFCQPNQPTFGCNSIACSSSFSSNSCSIAESPPNWVIPVNIGPIASSSQQPHNNSSSGVSTNTSLSSSSSVPLSDLPVGSIPMTAYCCLSSSSTANVPSDHSSRRSYYSVLNVTRKPRSSSRSSSTQLVGLKTNDRSVSSGSPSPLRRPLPDVDVDQVDNTNPVAIPSMLVAVTTTPSSLSVASSSVLSSSSCSSSGLYGCSPPQHALLNPVVDHHHDQRDLNQQTSRDNYHCCHVPPPTSDFFPPSIRAGTGSPSCSHMLIAFRYLLPQLLQTPLLHMLYLTDVTKYLYDISYDANDRELLKDVNCLLSQPLVSIQRTVAGSDFFKATTPRLSNVLQLGPGSLWWPGQSISSSGLVGPSESEEEEVNEVIRLVRRQQQDCVNSGPRKDDFVLDGTLFHRISSGLRLKNSERRAFLFRNCLVLCKKQPRGVSTASTNTSGSSTSSQGFKIKKFIPLESFHLIDHPVETADNGDAIFSFGLEVWQLSTAQLHRAPPHVTSTSSTTAQSSSNNTTVQSTLDQQSLCSVALSTGDRSRSPSMASLASSSSLQRPNSGSVSTLTSSNTLVSVDEPSVQSSSLMPTAAEAMAASSAALGDALAKAPKELLTFVCSSLEEKSVWLAALVNLYFTRLFNRYMRYMPRQDICLVLPSPDIYRFATPDSDNNLRLSSPVSGNSFQIPLIRAGTIDKLVERMTYHVYFDSKTIDTFLMTYRRFIRPQYLLDLLIERFNVPEPDFNSVAESTRDSTDGEDAVTRALRMEKRFLSFYKRRVQYRVLNFCIRWVKNDSYFKADFAPSDELRRRLGHFLDSVDKQPLLADNVANIRKSLQGSRLRLSSRYNYAAIPVTLDLGLAPSSDQVRLSNVHPVELARQLTLVEWELYSNIEFWEVSSNATDKPNHKAVANFSNKIMCWLIYCIMSTEQLDDRILVMQRVADLYFVCNSLGNMQGAQEAKAALISSPVLNLTKCFDYLTSSRVKPHYRTLFNQLRLETSPTYLDQQQDSDEGIDGYEAQLHSLNPPALPFLPTNRCSLLARINNMPDWIDTGAQSSRMVNFFKCDRIASLVSYFLSFQNFAYNFKVAEPIRTFFQNVDPYKMAGVRDGDEFDSLMHDLSYVYQPRGTSQPVAVNPSAVSTTSKNYLSPVEQRIGYVLSSANPVDQSVASKEFKALLHICAAAAPTTAVTIATAPSPCNELDVMDQVQPPLPPIKASSSASMSPTNSSFCSVPTTISAAVAASIPASSRSACSSPAPTHRQLSRDHDFLTTVPPPLPLRSTINRSHSTVVGGLEDHFINSTTLPPPRTGRLSGEDRQDPSSSILPPPRLPPRQTRRRLSQPLVTHLSHPPIYDNRLDEIPELKRPSTTNQPSLVVNPSQNSSPVLNVAEVPPPPLPRSPRLARQPSISRSDQLVGLRLSPPPLPPRR